MSPTLLVVATRADLTTATVVVESFLDHHPGRDVTVLVVDEVCSGSGRRVGPPWAGDRLDPKRLDAPAEVLDLEGSWADLRLARTALLPWAIGSVIDQGAEAVLALPPDAWVHRSLDEVTPTSAGSLAVLPRVLRPIPPDGFRPDLGDLASHGAFDDEVLAVTRGLATRELLRWWKQEIRSRARFNRSAGRPGALAPPGVAELVSVLPHRAVRDPGAGVGRWNLHERVLTQSNEGIRVNGHPLRLLRLAGLVAGGTGPAWPLGQQREPPPQSRSLIAGLTGEYLNQVRLVRGAEINLARRLALESGSRSQG